MNLLCKISMYLYNKDLLISFIIYFIDENFVSINGILYFYLQHNILLSSLFEIAIPLSLYKLIIMGLNPTKFGIHSTKPHSSLRGTTLCNLNNIN